MKKAIFCIAAVILLMIVTVGGIFIYHTEYKVILLDESSSPDGEYTLSLSSLGEPDFPFGYAYGKIVLKSDDDIVSETKIDLSNDGGQIAKNSWKVLWKEDYAKVYLYASEQSNEEWHFYFDGKTERKPQKFETYEDGKLKVEFFKNEQGFTAFSVDINNYIEVMNDHYRHYHPYDYLYPKDEWRKFSDETQYYGYASEQFLFVRDGNINCLPTVSVYTPENGNGIYEIKLTFDDHGYKKEMYEEYTEIVKSTFKAFMPKLSFDEIDKLYDKVYSSSNENFWGNHTDNSARQRQELKRIFCYENIGIYAFYGTGTANICIIPMTEEIQHQFITRGIKIEKAQSCV